MAGWVLPEVTLGSQRGCEKLVATRETLRAVQEQSRFRVLSTVPPIVALSAAFACPGCSSSDSAESGIQVSRRVSIANLPGLGPTEVEGVRGVDYTDAAGRRWEVRGPVQYAEDEAPSPDRRTVLEPEAPGPTDISLEELAEKNRNVSPCHVAT